MPVGLSGLPALQALRQDGWVEAAHGIMTIDIAPKGASVRVRLGEKEVTVTRGVEI
ncbi:MAG: hypothetical protein AABY83_01980 [Pseudomonadota bacterium]